jgi:hypothetical protein
MSSSRLGLGPPFSLVNLSKNSNNYPAIAFIAGTDVHGVAVSHRFDPEDPCFTSVISRMLKPSKAYYLATSFGRIARSHCQPYLILHLAKINNMALVVGDREFPCPPRCIVEFF